MKRVLRWRFYCEHCGKSSGSGGHMSRHEKHCTANPQRVCGMCGSKRDLFGPIAALGIGDDDGVNRLRDLVDGCPACMLAAIRQSKLQTPCDWDEDGQSGGFHVNFDFRKERAEWWAERNEEAMRREYAGY